MLWSYDGSFEGFLSAVVCSYEEKTLPDTLTCNASETTLFDAPRIINTDLKKAHTLLLALRKHLDKTITRRIYHAHLCDEDAIETALLRYVRLVLKSPAMAQHIGHSDIYTINASERRLFNVLHQMYGFVRFEMLHDGMLYAQIAPPCNVLPKIGAHFKKRFADEHFIIHDLKRQNALLYDTKTFDIQSVADFDIPQKSEDEMQFQQLWKRFFTAVAIQERANPKLQRRWVPLHYRELMHEFK